MFFNTIRIPEALRAFLERLAYVVCGIFVIFCSAQINMPLYPIPVTMQTAVVILVAMLYTKIDAVLSSTAYMVLGSLGLPIFSAYASGITILLGPRGGYIIGFVLATFVVSSIKKRVITQSKIGVIVPILAGLCSIYISGLLWLLRFLDISTAIKVGLLPFIVPEMLKMTLLILILSRLPRKNK